MFRIIAATFASALFVACVEDAEPDFQQVSQAADGKPVPTFCGHTVSCSVSFSGYLPYPVHYQSTDWLGNPVTEYCYKNLLYYSATCAVKYSDPCPAGEGSCPADFSYSFTTVLDNPRGACEGSAILAALDAPFAAIAFRQHAADQAARGASKYADYLAQRSEKRCPVQVAADLGGCGARDTVLLSAKRDDLAVVSDECSSAKLDGDWSSQCTGSEATYQATACIDEGDVSDDGYGGDEYGK